MCPTSATNRANTSRKHLLKTIFNALFLLLFFVLLVFILLLLHFFPLSVRCTVLFLSESLVFLKAFHFSSICSVHIYTRKM